MVFKQILSYQYMLFPAQDSYQLYFDLTLKDMGILQENADYFTYVQVEDEEGKSLKFIKSHVFLETMLRQKSIRISAGERDYKKMVL